MPRWDIVSQRGVMLSDEIVESCCGMAVAEFRTGNKEKIL